MSGIRELILGHMPFIGISYQSREKDKEYQKKFRDPQEIKKVLDYALKIGINKFAIASKESSSLAPLLLQVIKNIIDVRSDIELIPCVGIPVMIRNLSVDPYRRWATYILHEENQYSNVRNLVINDPIMNFRKDWKLKLENSVPYNSIDLQNIDINWKKIEEDLEYFTDFPVSHIEPGSETDFLVLAERWDLIGELIDRINERGFKGTLFGVHHAGVTIPQMDRELDKFDGYLTPLNPLGVMMFPTKTSAESAIRKTRKSVYAIKSMAGGRINPKTAFEYISSFNLQGCVIGCASVSELIEDFNEANKTLH
jgi:hypothetical protein